MNKIITIVFIFYLTCIISCKKEESDLNGQMLTYKRSEMLNKIYAVNKIRSKTHKLKSFADENREL